MTLKCKSRFEGEIVDKKNLSFKICGIRRFIMYYQNLINTDSIIDYINLINRRKLKLLNWESYVRRNEYDTTN